MKKQFILIPSLLLTGVLAGFIFSSASPADFFTREQSQAVRVNSADQNRSSESSLASGQSTARDRLRLANLETVVLELQARIEQMEVERYSIMELSNENVIENQNEEDPVFGQLAPFFENPLTAETPSMLSSLIRAGVDTYTAEEIARKQSEVELARLVLRDTAIREGYIRTKRYRDELRDLGWGTSIREEVGDEYFDRYLFASGRSNRIGVSSVMSGSAAEIAGIEKGDLIVSYGDKRLFNFRELRTATVEGDRNGLVDVTVMRDGFLFVMSIPRGPLGVRLSPARIDPDNS